MLLALIVILGCGHSQECHEVTQDIDYSAYSVDELNKHLDSLTALGEYCLVRGSEREYDTIIDHVRYIFVKDNGYDTPVDENKHLYVIRNRKEE